MKQFQMHASISFFDSFRAFAEAMPFGAEDLILVSGSLYEQFVLPLSPKCPVLCSSAFGKGEPTTDQVDRMRSAVPPNIRRIVAVGGGSVLDIAKMLSLRTSSGKTEDLFLSGETPERVYEVVAVPATCGTGSEVTNACAVELSGLHTKRGLSSGLLYPVQTVLIPELLRGLPYRVFATSSIDALIHAVESFMSPKATPHSLLFSKEAVRMILRGYRCLTEKGTGSWTGLAGDFLLAADYAGLAFSSAGCAAVHALSYPLGGGFHIPHGEANQLVFAATFRKYREKQPGGRLGDLEALVGECLGVSGPDALEALFLLLDQVLPRKPLRAYGVPADALPSFAQGVLAGQQRLLANSYVPLTAEDMTAIYEAVY